MNYSEKRLFTAQFKYWSIGLILLVLAIGSLYWGISRLDYSLNELGTESFVFGTGMFLIGMFTFWFYVKLSDKLDLVLEQLNTNIFHFKKGIKGELDFEEALKKHLTLSSRLIHSIDTGYGDIDFLLVDKRGLFVFEVKNYKGHMYIEDNFVWRVYNSGDKLIKDGKSPFIQVLNSKKFIESRLSSANLNTSITTVLAFVDDAVELRSRPQSIWICNGKNHLDYSLDRLLDRPKVLSEEDMKKIADLFS